MPRPLALLAGHRRADLALAFLALAGLAFLYTQLDAWQQRARARAALEETRQMVRELRLTDLCLFTEARYTRHPSQADLNTPFQDHPLALDHFPSGSLLPPPPQLTAPR